MYVSIALLGLSWGGFFKNFLPLGSPFRLLSADSSLGLRYLHPAKERNPSLGRVGIRALFAQAHLLRRQLQAILIAGTPVLLHWKFVFSIVGWGSGPCPRMCLAMSAGLKSPL